MWEIVTAPLILLLKGILIQFFVSKMNGRECVFSVSEMFCYKNREHDFFVSQKAQVLFFFFFTSNILEDQNAVHWCVQKDS